MIALVRREGREGERETGGTGKTHELRGAEPRSPDSNAQISLLCVRLSLVPISSAVLFSTFVHSKTEPQ